MEHSVDWKGHRHAHTKTAHIYKHNTHIHTHTHAYQWNISIDGQQCFSTAKPLHIVVI